MDITMAYGSKEQKIELPEQNIISIIEPEFPSIKNPLRLVEMSLGQPIASPTLGEQVRNKRPERVAVVVNDHTRPTPYDFVLPPLLNELTMAGLDESAIVLVVATGAHRGNSAEENLLSLGSVARRCAVLNHDCQSRDLARLGVLDNGSVLEVNPRVAAADLVILTGMIAPHELAGFSGGRKSVLPGIAGIGAITANHSLLLSGGTGTGKLDGNPVHRMMMDAMHLLKPDFLLNVVTNSTGLPVYAVAGDPEKAWLAGVDFCRKGSRVHPGTLADVAFLSAGGEPRDINLYQAIKSMRNAAKFVKKGGTLVVLARCAQGAGNDVLENWVNQADTTGAITARLQRGFVLGGHKAHLLAQLVENVDVALISDLPANIVRKFYMKPAESLAEAMCFVNNKHGAGYTAVIIPHPSLILPV